MSRRSAVVVLVLIILTIILQSEASYSDDSEISTDNVENGSPADRILAPQARCPVWNVLVNGRCRPVLKPG